MKKPKDPEPKPEAPVVLSLPVTRPKRYLCFDCPAHPTFLSLHEFKDHIAHGHPA